MTSGQAARIAVAAQGLHVPRAGGEVGRRHFRSTFDTLGLLQLDSVNVLVRSHYLPMFSRLGPYDVEALDAWTSGSGELFEYWGHAASLLDVADHPLYRWRMAETRPRAWVLTLQKEQPGFIESVLEQVAERGPLTAGDLVETGERTGPWWGYAPGKQALEWLFAKGKVTAYRDRRFMRWYDLPERVISAEVLQRETPSKAEAHRALLMAAGRRLGVATGTDLADYHRLKMPAVRRILADLVAEGQLEAVAVEGWSSPAYLDPRVARPRRARGTALLSPFDPLVWRRERAERLFDFHYRIEIYTPAEKRVFGYYVLPFMLDGDLVGRVDLKADRKTGRLLVRAAWSEEGQPKARVADELGHELRAMAVWLGLGAIDVETRGDLATPLRHVIG